MTVHIPERVDSQKTREADFMEGVLPSWLTAAGAGSVLVQNDNGGRAVLFTGTTSVGDQSAIHSFPFLADAYPIVRVWAEVEATSIDSSLLEPTVAIQNYKNGDSDYIQFRLNSEEIEASAGGSVTTQSTGACVANSRAVVELRWFVEEDRCEAYYADTKVGEISGSSTLPNPSRVDFRAVQFAETQDTSSDRNLKVYQSGWEYAWDRVR
jgi:hypothetical protein